MTAYGDAMGEKHDGWCHYPSEKCTCPQNNSKEGEFEVNLVVTIRGYGLLKEHQSNIIDKVTREMQLNFGGNLVQVDRLYRSKSLVTSHPVWIQAVEVDSAPVQSVDQAEEVPFVQAETNGGGS